MYNTIPSHSQWIQILQAQWCSQNAWYISSPCPLFVYQVTLPQYHCPLECRFSENKQKWNCCSYQNTRELIFKSWYWSFKPSNKIVVGILKANFLTMIKSSSFHIFFLFFYYFHFFFVYIYFFITLIRKIFPDILILD